MGGRGLEKFPSRPMKAVSHCWAFDAGYYIADTCPRSGLLREGVAWQNWEKQPSAHSPLNGVKNVIFREVP